MRLAKFLKTLSKSIGLHIKNKKYKNITLSLPAKRDVVIIDACGSDIIEKSILKLHRNIDFGIIYTRQEQLCFHPIIIFKTFCFLLAALKKRIYSIQHAYILALLDYNQAKLAITYIDNIDFFKHIHKFLNIQAIAIQNGIRIDADVAPLSKDHFGKALFFCFGNSDTELYSDYSIATDRFIPVGSVKASYYKQNLASKNNSEHIDICLISQFSPFLLNCSTEDPYFLLWEAIKYMHHHLANYLKKRSVKFGIAYRNQSNSLEIEYFDNLLGKKNIFRSRKSSYSLFDSYRMAEKSNLCITLNSTLGFEVFGWGQKVLFCHGIKPLYDEAIVEYYSPLPEIVWINSQEYDEFEIKLDNLLSISEAEYLRKIENVQNNVMNGENGFAHEIIGKKVEELLKLV